VFRRQNVYFCRHNTQKGDIMIVVYFKKERDFVASRDMKQINREYGIPMSVLRAARIATIDTEEYTIGLSEVLTSKRGGKRHESFNH